MGAHESTTIHLPASLKAAVREVCRAEGTSINQFVNTAVAEKLAALKTAGFFTERASKADIEAARRLLRRDGGQPPAPADRGDAEGAPRLSAPGWRPRRR